ncbi:hypothetical protein [Xanthomonas fragariae]|uniref:hypothetical protein n=1 Tax=Xanthomonas fragariae TaxID=48664 RepID=UPI001F420401|nr:hypothetical protein [Xanthomonas fragariae]
MQVSRSLLPHAVTVIRATINTSGHGSKNVGDHAAARPVVVDTAAVAERLGQAASDDAVTSHMQLFDIVAHSDAPPASAALALPVTSMHASNSGRHPTNTQWPALIAPFAHAYAQSGAIQIQRYSANLRQDLR